jgi:hypothetical protein
MNYITIKKNNIVYNQMDSVAAFLQINYDAIEKKRMHEGNGGITDIAEELLDVTSVHWEEKLKKLIA